MTPDYRAALHNAPPSLSALETADRDAFVRVCRQRHDAARERWLEDRRPPIGNRLLARVMGNG